MTSWSLPGFPDLGRTRVMGVLNVTPDSFSDGGAFLDPELAIAHGISLARQGADIIDVGGESTRPGAVRVNPDIELQRVVPVVRGLVGAAVAVSIDTTRAVVAEAALDAGAVLVNDVSGGHGDPQMLALLARRKPVCVLMHSRGESRDMGAGADYDNVVVTVRAELAARLSAAVRAGVDSHRVVLDPGIGFHKTADQNWALLAQLDLLASLGRPMLVGTSRKSFLGALLAAGGEPRQVSQRDAASHATTALAALAGVWAVRVHDVGPSVDAVRVAAAWAGARVDEP